MNMTLKGGIEAGYFRKLAQHVAMQLCVELCCEEKGCDVAVMNGKNCFGVQCFNEELCRSIPVKKHTDNPFQISHVTFKAEKGKLDHGRFLHFESEKVFLFLLETRLL